MTARELVGPLPTVTFTGGPDRRLGVERPRVAYDVPKNTLDPRYVACTDHHVACDCREAELAEQLGEHRAEWAALHSAARRALAGHQVERPWGFGEDDEDRVLLCLCSGCVIYREQRALLAYDDVDWRTGRVKPPAGSLAMGWALGEVPF